MKKLIAILVAASMLTFFLAGCAKLSDQKPTEEVNVDDIYRDKEDGKLLVVTTLFPTYSLTKAIAPNADVRLLLPPGADSHSFEPSPKDMILLENSDLVVFTGEYMEEWMNKVLSSLNLDSKKNCRFIYRY